MAANYIERCVSGVRKSEHVWVAEKLLGRALTRNECVHHVDENKRNNRPGNLVVCTLAYHNLIHKRMRALAACGDASAHRCQTCGEYRDQSDMHVRRIGPRTVSHHRECERKTERARKCGG